MPRPARTTLAPALVATLTAAALVLTACAPAAPRSSPTGSAASGPSSAAPEPTRDPLEGLTLEQRVGQLFVVGSDAGAADPAAVAAVHDRHVGGVFLGGRSAAGAPATLRVTQALTAASTDGIPLTVSTDQEGGQVQVLRGPGFAAIPSAVEQGAMSPEALRTASRTWGAQLRSAGVNLDLAPVADVVPPGREGTNPPVGGFDRQYGSDAAAVASHAAAVAAGLRDSGVGAVAKHFPGLGEVRGNTDTTAGVIDDATSADSPSVTLYGELARSGIDAVMLSTAVYPRIDPGAPAAFSRPVVDLLRGDRIGFDGVVMTDDVSAAEQVAAIPIADRATRAIDAGVDLVLVAHHPEIVGGMIDAVVARAAGDPAFAARVDAAARRVLAWKAVHLGARG